MAKTAMIGMPGTFANNEPVPNATRPRIEPTERSTLRVMITSA
jgi:hypothetical protein